TGKTGTARQFASAKYTVAAKTGTAQNLKTRSDHGVFIAYAPAENPEVAIAVLLENGTSKPAANLAKTILDAYFASKGKGISPTPEGVLLP
ncbi:MAG TPA: penicillin-binding transpeptidase domain-containing protein, partial [Candidatus Avimonas sp.]|nr:penicillin-binding transpeptidase domain-containing protein [Candidatus Avimonas sp.]